MVITFLGKQFFKISQGDLVLAFNPISKDSKSISVPSRFGSNLALSTINHPDYNGFETVSYGESFPFAISGPGDYEIRDIFIKGILSNTEIDGKKYINTIYKLSIEGISVCFLGVVTDEKLIGVTRDQISSPDILFVPVNHLEPAKAYKLAVALEPKIIIPMDYDEKSLKMFIKEAGIEKINKLDKLTIKSKELIGREGEVIVLAS